MRLYYAVEIYIFGSQIVSVHVGEILCIIINFSLYLFVFNHVLFFF